MLGISAVPQLGQQQHPDGCRVVALGVPPSHLEGQPIPAQGTIALVQLAPSAAHCLVDCRLIALVICSSFPPALGGGSLVQAKTSLWVSPLPSSPS